MKLVKTFTSGRTRVKKRSEDCAVEQAKGMVGGDHNRPGGGNTRQIRIRHVVRHAQLGQDIFENRAIHRLLRPVIEFANPLQWHEAPHKTLKWKQIRALQRRRGREQTKVWHTP
jgi:hypothetical protein